jgi:hypothetical protein
VVPKLPTALAVTFEANGLLNSNKTLVYKTYLNINSKLECWLWRGAHRNSESDLPGRGSITTSETAMAQSPQTESKLYVALIPAMYICIA